MELHIHVHIHDHRDTPASNAPVLAAIAQFRSEFMATAQGLKDILDAINATTNEMATVVDQVIADDAAEDAAFQAEIDRLKALIASGSPVTQAQLDALATSASTSEAKLIAVRDALKATGLPSEPAPPVVIPPVVPPVDPPVEDPNT